jgi:diguanylate cyclase (GGDEF)-like protein
MISSKNLFSNCSPPRRRARAFARHSARADAGWERTIWQAALRTGNSLQDFGSLLSLIWGALALVALVAIQSIVVVGRWRRNQWNRQAQRLDATGHGPTVSQLMVAQRARRASDFLDVLSRRLYYALTLGSALTLIALPFLSLPADIKFYLGLILKGTALGGALLLLFAWSGWNDERERQLRQQLVQEQEHLLAQRGLIVRDPVTEVYTAKFWLYVLNLQVGKTFRHPTPISCVTVDVVGLEALRAEHGDQAADHTLKMVGQALVSNVRAYDVVCYCHDKRFAIALLRCPSSVINRAAERTTQNVTRLILGGVNRRYNAHLELVWQGATLPDQAPTPDKLLAAAERSLDRALSVQAR